jgi:hypothetical protein
MSHDVIHLLERIVPAVPAAIGSMNVLEGLLLYVAKGAKRLAQRLAQRLGVMRNTNPKPFLIIYKEPVS